MAIRRSKPLSINQSDAKPRVDFDFHLPNTSAFTMAMRSDLNLARALNALDPDMDNTEHLLDDEANFEME